MGSKRAVFQTALFAKDEAIKCYGADEEKPVLFGLTGTGCFDMYAYEKFHDGKMSDYAPTDEELAEFRKGLKY